ncbi:aminotransferase class IV [bacterium]|nr:aminotransferase class IV [bacterium]
MIVYYNGDYIEKKQVIISPDDRGFLFADGTYEVIRVYHHRIFRLDNHLQRLRRSLQEIEIDHMDVSFLRETGETLIQRNPEIARDAVMYIQITRGAAPRHHEFPDQIQPTVYAALSRCPVERNQIVRGIKIILQPDQRWGRCDIKSIALLPNILAAEEARRQDAYEAVFVRDGIITEGTRTNIAAVFNGQVHTHPIGHHILGGITRDIVLELCGKMDIPVIEKPISEEQIMLADEVFLMGTTTEIGPVIQVNEIKIGEGSPGPVTKQLRKAFQGLIDNPDQY